MHQPRHKEAVNAEAKRERKKKKKKKPKKERKKNLNPLELAYLAETLDLAAHLEKSDLEFETIA